MRKTGEGTVLVSENAKIFLYRAAYYRLKSQYEKLSTELQIEKDVERNTAQTLEDAEYVFLFLRL